MLFTKKISYLVCASAMALTAEFSLASGYHFGTQSVSAQSTANASAAEAGDASTIFYNSAGMTKLDGTHVSANLNFVMPSSKYSGAKAGYPASTQEVQGKDHGTITPDVVVAPHGYITHKINDRVAVGVGVYVPFGSETAYSEDSVLRYNVNKTKLTTIDINPTIAFKATENHSFGVGLIAQYTTAELRQYANLGAFVGANGAADAYADVKGNDWGVGYNLSWLWDVTPDARIGVNYRSKIDHKLKGTAKWKMVDDSTFLGGVMGAQKDGLGYKSSEGASVKIQTPESLSVHGMYKIDPKWNVFGDVTWTRHSRFDTVDIMFENEKRVGATQVSSQTRLNPKWKNTFKYALGASYQVSDPWQLRFGIAYDQSPVPSADYRLSTIPDNDRIWYSLGGQYKLNDHSSLSFAYSYIHIKSAKANVNGYCGTGSLAMADCVSSKTAGSANYKSNAQILGLQYNYNF